MRNHQLLRLLFSAVLLLVAVTATAQDAGQTADPISPLPGETIDAFVGRLTDLAEAKQKKAVADMKQNGAPESVNQEMAAAASAEVAQKPTVAAPPPAFADSVNSSIADFLPWFQFAINEVTSSEDKTSVTAKFNPLPVGIYGNLSLSTTASEPQVFKPLEDRIVEAAREAERKTLLGRVDDFSDLTLAATYGYQRRGGTWDNTRKLFGRNYELYRKLASELLGEALSASVDFDEPTDRLSNTRRAFLREHRTTLEAAAKEANVPVEELGRVPLDAIAKVSPHVHSELVSLLVQQAQLSADVTVNVQQTIREHKLDAIPAMIDNQPQLLIQGSYRSSDEVIGPDALAITATYEMGSRNFNAALREYRQMKHEGVAASRLKAFEQAVTNRDYRHEDKLIFSASYRRNRHYDFSHPYVESVAVPGSTTQTEIARTAAVELPSWDSWRASATWTRLWPRRPQQTGNLSLAAGAGGTALPSVSESDGPRSTFSLEWVEADQRAKIDGKALENDRLIARLSLVVPLPGGMTMPLTVVYSEDPELLKDQDRVFSTHFGISYKMGQK